MPVRAHHRAARAASLPASPKMSTMLHFLVFSRSMADFAVTEAPLRRLKRDVDAYKVCGRRASGVRSQITLDLCSNRCQGAGRALMMSMGWCGRDYLALRA